jgi:hypothetical protein
MMTEPASQDRHSPAIAAATSHRPVVATRLHQPVVSTIRHQPVTSTVRHQPVTARHAGATLPEHAPAHPSVLVPAGDVW